MKTKICSKCKKEKLLSEFYKRKASKDNLSYRCKKCHKEYVRKWKQDNPGKVREHNKKWRKDNLEYFKKYRKEYYEENAEKVKERTRKWEEENAEKARENRRKWREENTEKMREFRRKWEKNNPEKRREYQKKWYQNNKQKKREYQKKWRENNPEKTREIDRKCNAQRRQQLDYKELFENPFKGDVHWHHITNKYVVALPGWVHILFYCGADIEEHRALLEPIVYEIYYMDKGAIK